MTESACTGREHADLHALVGDARLAIEEIDSVIGLSGKLLQIDAAESGVPTRSFEPRPGREASLVFRDG